MRWYILCYWKQGEVRINAFFLSSFLHVEIFFGGKPSPLGVLGFFPSCSSWRPCVVVGVCLCVCVCGVHTRGYKCWGTILGSGNKAKIHVFLSSLERGWGTCLFSCFFGFFSVFGFCFANFSSFTGVFDFFLLQLILRWKRGKEVN